MREFLRATFVALSVGVIISVSPVCFAQEPQPAARKIVSQVVPTYPELASKMQITGTVKVEVLVGPNGKAKSTQVVGGSPVLVKAALDAIDKWKWAPAPQESKELIQLNFHP